MKRALTIGTLVWTAAIAALCVWTAGVPSARASEVGFIEDYALAADRAKTLAQLIPGTEDYYYYHCLNHQARGEFDKVEPLLKLWIDRHQYTARVKEIQLRQALLTYEKDSAGSLAFLNDRLQLRFNHQREILGQKPDLPVSLDQALIGRDALTKAALSRHQNTDGFEDVALEWLSAAKLEPERLRHLLSRLRRPDVPGLVPLIVADLEYKNSGGFGRHPIHGLLLLSQLDELLKAKPELLNQSAFVRAYLAKLAPGPDEDLRFDVKAMEAHLDRQWAFVSRLAPVHNSLKAHVLYHRLAFDRTRGVYDRERFDTYVKLPRPVAYINPKYMERDECRRYPVNLGEDFRAVTLHPPIQLDEPLVRDYLMRFLKDVPGVDAPAYKAYLDYVHDVYLREALAETKIVHGIGDQEQWYSLLPPGKVQALKERVDIDFAPTNKSRFAPEEAVALEVDVKNVPTLIVKVFEINALNFYRDNLSEVGTDINLDGLVANQQKTYEYKDSPPVRRVRRTIPAEDLPALKGRGVYVVELIGGGKSSRALVFKGRLHLLQRPSVAGHVLTVLDEGNKKVADAKVWLAGREYAPDKDGRITIPYSTAPGTQKLILISGGLASLAEVVHQAEQYALRAGFHVEREALLKGRKATLAVRPAFTVNGMPAPLAVLEEVTLLVSSVDHDGIATTKEVADFKLFEDKESPFEFQVPDRLSAVAFTLKAKVKNLSKGTKEDLAVSQTFSLNQIDKTEKVEDLHLTRAESGWVIDLLGRSGEAKSDRAIQFQFKHRDFRVPAHASLKTDAKGRITLGALKDVVSVTASGPEGTTHTWALPRDDRTYPSTVCAKAGAERSIYIPYMGVSKDPTAAEFSLLERRGGTFAKDHLSAMKIKDGFLVLEGLPAGDYDLLVKSDGTSIRVLVSGGEEAEGYVNSPTRRLEIVNPALLQIVSVQADAQKLTVKLANAGKDSRVVVAATRYLPQYPLLTDLDMPITGPFILPVDKLASLYVSGRNIGDEYRYILDRQSALKFPGNMLTRPGLILNPWSIRKTEAGVQVARGGEAYGRALQPSIAARPGEGGMASRRGRAMESQAAANLPDLDFLPEGAAVLLNLRPDEKGVVTINRKDLGGHQHVHILAVDSECTVYRQIALAERELKPLDLRLAKGLDAKKHFAEQKRITALEKDGKLTIADAASAKMEIYDDLASVHRLYCTLSGDATLAEFAFITNWPKLAPEKKRELYSKYACHELNFFLARKDAAFFDAVVKPYLANKKDKTFLDRYLTGEDLSAYLAPWTYERLNTAERAILARRIAAEAASIRRDIKDDLDLIPPDLDRFNRLFLTALRGKALETAGGPMGGVAFDDAPRLELRRKNGAFGEDRSAARPAAPPAAALAPAPKDELAKTADALKELKDLQEDEKAAEGLAKGRLGVTGGGRGLDKADLERRKEAQQFYRKLDKTEEWAENNYYHLPIESQVASLVGVNPFWNDYAAAADGKPFLSTNLAEASHNFAEMMMALAVLDLPFEAAKHEVARDGRALTLTAGGAAIIFHKEVQEAPGEASKAILVSQNFYRHGERYIQVGNEQVDKFIADEFLSGVVYGCQVVITNPTSTKQKIEVLLQVPAGAIPVLNGQETRSVRMDLEPYRTATMDYFFYFPLPGEFPHYPLHVAKEGKLLAAAEPFTFKVLDEPTKVDTKSWDYISQNGTPAQVVGFINANNLGRVNLGRIAWRFNEKDGEEFFGKVIGLLTSRKVYNHTLWSYGLKHNVPEAIRQYLMHCDGFVAQAGDWIESPLLSIDPVARKTYQHLEYAPFVNARAHQLGKRREIVNERLAAQYHHLLKILTYRPALDDDDRMAVTYYLLLQDRVEEGKGFFAKVDAAKLPTRLQHDYFAAYIDLYSDQPKAARELAAKYKDYGVDRWRKLFAEVVAQLDQIEGKAPAVIDEESRLQKQTQLAAKSPSLELKVEDRKVKITAQNLEQVTVNYYLMDVELMFSTNPFVQQQGGQFSYIRPNKTETVRLPAAAAAGAPGAHAFDLPKEFTNANVLVEVVGGGLRKSQAYYANSLTLELVENYGQVRAMDEAGKPLPKTYVKVYARMKDGAVAFFKDGYTDLRGRFDYASLNTDELDRVAKFAILILSDSKGAVVKEAAPPKR